MELRSVLLILFLSLLLQACGGSGTLKLQFVRYYSSAGCGGTFITDVCDFVFSVDATTEVFRNGSWQPHKAVSFTTKVYKDQQDVNFSMGLDAFGNGLSNPIGISFERPVLNMSVSSIDMDTATWPYAASNTSVADLSFSLNVSSVGTVTRKISYSTGYLQLIYQVYCGADYTGVGCEKCITDRYGADCSVRCKAESNHNGNYTCNATTGARICPADRAPPDCTSCATNLYGAFCNISCISTTRSGCDSNGTVACLGNRAGPGCLSCIPSYYSSDCSVYCVPGLGWGCGTNGARSCNVGWRAKDCINCAAGYYGSQCDIQCSPVTGRYNCSNNGTKQCLPRWDGPECDICLSGYYGNNCTIYCVNATQYTCNTNGTRVCMVGWDGENCSTCSQDYYGAKCDIKCVPKPGVYSCDSNANGAKRCQGNRGGIDCGGCVDGWFGVDCDVHCVPEKRFSCDAKGRRVCRSYWSGANCSICREGRTGPECGSCAPHYYGEDCQTFCVGSDSIIEGHYVCNERGDKICISGWIRSETNCTKRERYINIDSLEPSQKSSTQTNIKSLTRSAIMIGVSSLSIFFLILIIFWAVNRKHRRSRIKKRQNKKEGERREEQKKEEEKKEEEKKEEEKKEEEKKEENSKCVDKEEGRITESVLFDGYNFYYTNPVYVDVNLEEF